jgi:hypothetical protein
VERRGVVRVVEWRRWLVGWIVVCSQHVPAHHYHHPTIVTTAITAINTATIAIATTAATAALSPFFF